MAGGLSTWDGLVRPMSHARGPCFVIFVVLRLWPMAYGLISSHEMQTIQDFFYCTSSVLNYRSFDFLTSSLTTHLIEKFIQI